MAENDTTKKSFSTNKIGWIAGAIVLLAVGIFGLRFLISSFGSNYRVTLVDAPKEVPAGSLATFTWRVDGPATTIHYTTVHYGKESTPGELGTEVVPRETKYTDFVKDFSSGDFNIPLQFVGNTSLKDVGGYYFRVHALVKDKNYWSDEYTFTVKPAEYKIVLIDTPKQVTVGTITSLTWRVEGSPTTINSTAVYFGPTSNPDALGKEIEPKDSKYPYALSDFAKGRFDIPLQFVGNLKVASPGAYFFRVHADIKGENYWTDEGTFEVTK